MSVTKPARLGATEPAPPVSDVAQRVAAHRASLAVNGYVRSEVVIPQAVRERVQSIASSESTSYLEALSALAQLGLRAYESAATPSAGVTTPVAAVPGANALRCAMDAPAADSVPASDRVTASVAASAAPAASPIAAFFRKRREG